MSIKSSLFQIGFTREFFTLYHRQDVSVSTNCEVFFSLHYFQKFLTEISWCFKDWEDIRDVSFVISMMHIEHIISQPLRIL